jgi:hypothetical protein
VRLAPLILLCCFMCVGCSSASAQEQPAKTNEPTITIPRSEFEAIKARLEAVERELQELKEKVAAPQAAPPAEVSPAPAEQPPAPAPEAIPPAAEQPAPVPEEVPPAAPAPGGAGRALMLPDISLIVQAKGKLTTDKRDDARDRVRLTEAELGIQGYVYPNVKADAFITMSPAEDAAAQVEEAYLTYLGASRGLNVYVGKKHVAFGRTNLLHNHSWLYVNPPKVLRNLVAEESLSGEGLAVSYLLPTKSDLFAQLDLGTWTGEGPGEASNPPGIVTGPGANFADRFNTARLWTSYPVTENSELELGGSYAGGAAGPLDDASGGRARLTGVDLTYRRFGEGTSRLLLRSEAVWRHQSSDAGDRGAMGYYLFGNYRKTKYASLGLLYDWSQFPQAPDLHETALSLIWTKQFSEQYYLRLQGTHGSRPGDSSYEELWLQWVWGVGPHTHNLE